MAAGRGAAALTALQMGSSRRLGPGGHGRFGKATETLRFVLGQASPNAKVGKQLWQRVSGREGAAAGRWHLGLPGPGDTGAGIVPPNPPRSIPPSLSLPEPQTARLQTLKCQITLLLWQEAAFGSVTAEFSPSIM